MNGGADVGGADVVGDVVGGVDDFSAAAAAEWAAEADCDGVIAATEEVLLVAVPAIPCAWQIHDPEDLDDYEEFVSQ